MIAVIKFKRHIADANIFNIAIYKFYYQNKFYLVFLFKFDNNSEIYFYYTFMFFYLAINLRVKDGKKFLLNI